MKAVCSKCGNPGFRFHGQRWLCEVHMRIDTMRECARRRSKTVPTAESLELLFVDAISGGMKCGPCGSQMVMSGRKGNLTTVTLQHDRSGEIRLMCMLCNQRHDDMPGDTFYDLPKDHWYCARCKKVLPLTDFYKNRVGACCKLCRKSLNKEMWAKYGKTWQANSQRRKQNAGR